jgi:CDP-2,3-bis-(O-geranylgeranyl)-sn-glycerol synthase
MGLVPTLRALLLLAAASSVPWAVGRVLGDRFAWPLDFGFVLRDGERLFGDHKTWRGFAAGTAACAIVGWAAGPGCLAGAGVGAVALAGDALSSAIKRRFHRPPGTEILGLDQVPEALFPLLVFQGTLGLSMATVFAVTLIFAALDVGLTPLRHR